MASRIRPGFLMSNSRYLTSSLTPLNTLKTNAYYSIFKNNP
ncbi:hypothetical protein [Leptospira noguchii]|nr:hypothetical protein [Leptospira noguchii]